MPSMLNQFLFYTWGFLRTYFPSVHSSFQLRKHKDTKKMGQCFKTLEKGQCWRQEVDSDAVTLEIQQVSHLLQRKASLRGCSYIYLLVATEKCKKMALSYSLRRHLHRKISNSVAIKIKGRQLSIILHFLKVRKCLIFYFFFPELSKTIHHFLYFL